MKAQIKKSKTAAKPAVKAPKALKLPVKAAAKALKKPAAPAKPAGKPAPKLVVKPVVKAKAMAPPVKSKPKAAVVAKKAVKPAAKPVAAKKVTVAKPVLKKMTKTAAAKSATNLAPTAAKKAVIKPVVKAVSVAKPLQKVKAAATAPVKSPAKTAPKSDLKASAKTTAKTPVVAASKVAQKPVAVAPVAALASATPSSNGLPPVPPLKPGRRSSSRAFAHMPPPAPMVPTHAPDAAKASYSTMIERVIAPPPHVAAKKDPKLANNWKTKAAEALSDDEVKAMPDAEYMNEKQLAFFRAKLSVLKQEIHNSAGATTEHLREDTVVVPDPADRATIEEEHALELRTRDRERKLLKKIEQSIGRIDSGDYGYCDETGEPIGVGRLIARPTASLSLEAQQRRELKQKMFGD